MRVAVAALLVVALAGCLSLVPDDDPTDGPDSTASSSGGPSPAATPSRSPSPSPAPPQEPTLFVLVERGFGFNRTSGEGGLTLAIGSHCGLAGWTLDPARVSLLDWSPSSSGTSGPSGTSSGTTTSGPSPDPWGPSGIVVGAIRQDWIHNQSYGTYGHGSQVYALDAQAGSLGIPGAFGGRVVANVTALDGAVSVDGQPVPAGGNVTVRVAYLHTATGQPPSTFAVEERIQVTNAGLAVVDKQGQGRYCI